MLVRPFTASSSDTVPAIQGKKIKIKKQTGMWSSRADHALTYFFAQSQLMVGAGAKTKPNPCVLHQHFVFYPKSFAYLAHHRNLKVLLRLDES